MTRETGYFVQSFNAGKGGSLKAPLWRDMKREGAENE